VLRSGRCHRSARTPCGRSTAAPLKLLTVIDEYTHECPAIVVARSIDADHVVAILDRIGAVRSCAISFSPFSALVA
jgi:hypothetical protein